MGIRSGRIGRRVEIVVGSGLGNVAKWDASVGGIWRRSLPSRAPKEGRMLSKAQERALVALRQKLESYPDARIGQLIVNVCGIDPFYMEDAEFVERMERWPHVWKDVGESFSRGSNKEGEEG